MIDTVPIILSTDNNYALFAETTLASIYAHISKEKHYHIFVLYTDLEKRYIASLESFSRENFTVSCVCASAAVSKFSAMLSGRGHITASTFYRLFIPTLFPEYDTAIYVDCDVIFFDDIGELLSSPLGEHLIAGVRETYAIEEETARRAALGTDPNAYFNAGFIAINCSLWRKENVLEKCLFVLNSAPSGVLKLLDQDVLNIVCKGRVLFLAQEWNLLWHHDKGANDMVLACPVNEARMLHYVSRIKPWTDPSFELSRYFWQYAAMIPDYRELFAVPFKAYQNRIDNKNRELTMLNQLLAQEMLENEKLKKQLNKCQRFGKAKAMDKGLDKISVILPVFNREKIVPEAIESIIDQTYTNWELLIIDDGSSDGTGAVCDDYQAKDSRIRVFHIDNHGVSHARNVGLANVTGDWVAFIDSDDLYQPYAFSEMIAHSAGADMVATRTIVMPQYELRGSAAEEPVMMHTREDFVRLNNNWLTVEVWGKLYKRDRIFHRFDESFHLGEDRLFNVEFLSANDNISYVPVFAYIYRWQTTGNSLVAKFDNGYLFSAHELFVRQHQLFNSPDIDGVYLAEFVNAAVLSVYSIVNMDDLPEAIKLLFISSALEHTILQYRDKVKPDVVPPRYAEFWELLMTGDANKIYTAYKDYFDTREERSDPVSVPEPTMAFTMQAAGLTIRISHRYDLIRDKCRDYIVPDVAAPDLEIVSSPQRIIAAKKWCLEFDNNAITDEYAEYDSTPYIFYPLLAQYDALWLHSVVVEKDGAAYAFTALPGTGKSTHAQLWLRAFPDARIINGDNAIIRLLPDGQFFAYGTPFCGKEGHNVNVGVPLKGICFLQRAEENRISPMRAELSMPRLVSDNHCITPETMRKHLTLYRKLVSAVPCYTLECNMDIEAAYVAFNGMNNKD